MDLKVIEATLVRPAEETPRKHLWMSNVDLLVPIVHVPSVYFYESDGSPNFFEPEALKDGLSKALVPFYPVAGRAGRDKDGRLEIYCNSEGALFILSDSDYSLNEFGDLRSSLLKQMSGYVDYSSDISSYPLLVLQVTRLKCGTVCMGVWFHHTVIDGVSGINFINTWSNMVRGGSETIMSPSMVDRTVLRARDPPSPIFPHDEYSPSPHNAKKGNVASIEHPPLPTVVHLTRDHLNSLMAKYSIGGENGHDDLVKFSPYEILSALMWRCLCKLRDLPDDQPTTLYIPTDGRSRLSPPLPQSYLGNVLFSNRLTLSAGAVQSEPLAGIAGKIHEAITKMTGDYLRSAIDFLEMQSDLTVLRRGANTFASPNVNVISWMRMPIYDADFGWGRPTYMGPFITFEGNIFIVPRPSKADGLSLVLVLKPHQVELFKKFLY